MTETKVRKYRLPYRVHRLLCEALRRYTRFHPGEDMEMAWTGLGFASEYKPVVDAGLMRFAHHYQPRCNGWLIMTEGGAAIVKVWISQGYTYERIERGDLPPREVEV